MKFAFRRVGFDFIDTARKTWVVSCDLAAPRDEVWGAISDPTTWKAWFPGVDRAWYSSDPPHGVGAIREAIVSGQHFVEEMVTWDEGVRWAYCITSATVPLAAAQVECHELEDCEGGTRVRWTIIKGRRAFRDTVCPPALPTMRSPNRSIVGAQSPRRSAFMAARVPSSSAPIRRE